MDSNIFEKANRIIKTCDAAYLGVIDENGFPSVSTVSVIKPENIFETYFSANVGSNKEKRLSKNKKASICYRSGGNNITLVGEAEILIDQETKSRYWIDWFTDHYRGETDPNYCIIKVTTKRVSLWVDSESAEFTIDELLKVQSRCGLLCKWCTYKDSNGCGGCIETNGHPFYGECPVAMCCQEKGYSHCGECVNSAADTQGFVPCDHLRAYSCEDLEHGDNPPGSRIAVCRAWAGRSQK